MLGSPPARGGSNRTSRTTEPPRTFDRPQPAQIVMSRIAILSDIHGNVPALEAVVSDIATQNCDEVLVGGDLVGRGPQGDRVVERVVGLGWRSIRGNHEDYLLGFRHGKVEDDWLVEEQWAASRWMAAELSHASVKAIEAQPFSLVAESAPALRLVHGTPQSNRQGIGPWTSTERLDQHLGQVDEPFLVCAHTHRPLERRLADGWIVNTGSVGLPFNGDRRAQYLIVETENDDWSVEFRQVEYDLDDILTIYEQTGFRREGLITAELLRLELLEATPFLAPFLEWASIAKKPRTAEQLGAFLEFYDPGEPLRAFFERLRDLNEL